MSEKAGALGPEAGIVLSVSGLTVTVGGPRHPREVVSDLSFDLKRGETLCVAGESGSGKSMTALAVMGLLPAGARAAGSIQLGQSTELAGMPERRMRRIRGDRIAMIFQEPMTSLNPVLTVGRQLTEAVRTHRSVSSREAERIAVEALDAVRMPQARSRLGSYPHELSGGQRQRVMIAMALALRPDVLLADEPTTALDVTVQAQVLELLRELQAEIGMGVLLITHDMGVVAEMADRVVVMRHGHKVEENGTLPLFETPGTDYTRALLAAVPRIGSGPGRQAAEKAPPAAAVAPVVSVENLVVRFPVHGGLLGRTVANVHAVEDISFAIRPGETLSLVGESGCGKSTTARALAGLLPFSGEITIGGRHVGGLDRAGRKAVRRDVQMVFQDPYASLDPRMTVGDLVREPLDIHGVGDAAERRERVAFLFERTGLPPESTSRFPHEFSGGQRQRISIARALALQPKLIIADESVSALDVSIQARVLDLLRKLQAETGVSYLFISHDMAVVENISDRVAVMFAGRIVETGSRDRVFGNPLHPYTKRLIEAVPVPNPAKRRARPQRVQSDPPATIKPVGASINPPRLMQVEQDHWIEE